MVPLILKRQHFQRQPAYLSPEVISNGHWALRRTPKLISNANMLISPEVAEVVLGCPVRESPLTMAGMCGTGQAPWTVTPYLWDNGRLHFRLLVDGRGGVAGLNDKYLAMVDLDQPGRVLYSDVAGVTPFRDGTTPEKTNVVIMPGRLPIGLRVPEGGP